MVQYLHTGLIYGWVSIGQITSEKEHLHRFEKIENCFATESTMIMFSVGYESRCSILIKLSVYACGLCWSLMPLVGPFSTCMTVTDKGRLMSFALGRLDCFLWK